MKNVQTFLTRCPRTQFKGVARWAVEVTKRIYAASAQLPAIANEGPAEEKRPPGTGKLVQDWKNKEFSLTLTRLQDGGMHVKVWQAIRSEKRKQRSIVRRLQRIHEAGGAASAVLKGLSGAGAHGIRDAEVAEEHAAEAQAEGLIASFGDPSSLPAKKPSARGYRRRSAGAPSLRAMLRH